MPADDIAGKCVTVPVTLAGKFCFLPIGNKTNSLRFLLLRIMISGLRRELANIVVVKAMYNKNSLVFSRVSKDWELPL